MDRRHIALSLVERGWQAAREWSLDAGQRGVSVVHLVKGYVAPEVRDLIPRDERMCFLAVPRSAFWPAAWGLLAWFALSGALQVVVVDNERSLRRLRRCARRLRVQLTMVLMGQEGSIVKTDDLRPAASVPQGRWDDAAGVDLR